MTAWYPSPVPKLSIPQLRPNQVAIVVGAVGVVIVVVIAFFFFRKPGSSVGAPVTLAVWGTEPATAMRPLLESYGGIRPNVTATYREIEPAAYADTLVDALASGEGPDVFTVPSTDIGITKGKLMPAPATLSPALVQTTFPKAVESDVIDGGQVWALPLSLDTLVLLYNRDLLDAAGVIAPPATWQEVADLAPRLSTVNAQGQVERSGIALGGTSVSVRETADIVSLLMLQNGTPLANQAHTSVTLGAPAEAALSFYAQFANPASSAYSWNDSLGSSFQRFADGKVALLVAYPDAAEAIRELNPFVDVRAARVPQASGGAPRSYGAYPTLAVSKQSQNASWGWDLVQAVTTDKAIMSAYAAETGRAAALSSVIGDQIAAASTTLVGTQALQARSWFQWDGAGVRREIDGAVSDIVSGSSDAGGAASSLEARLRALVR